MSFDMNRKHSSSNICVTPSTNGPIFLLYQVYILYMLVCLLGLHFSFLATLKHKSHKTKPRERIFSVRVRPTLFHFHSTQLTAYQQAKATKLTKNTFFSHFVSKSPLNSMSLLEWIHSLLPADYNLFTLNPSHSHNIFFCTLNQKNNIFFPLFLLLVWFLCVFQCTALTICTHFERL